jgi:hypothetical protein
VTACANCGKPLTDPTSILRGVGPECLAMVTRGQASLRYQITEHAHQDPFLQTIQARLDAGRKLTPRLRRLAAWRIQHPPKPTEAQA